MDKFEFKLNESFSDYVTTFKQTSFDEEHSQYLCNDESNYVFDFDEIVKSKYPDKQPKSFDAILCDGKNIFCVEFKNSLPSDIDNSNVQGKLINSQSVIEDFCLKNHINKSDYKFIYCVVFKPFNSPYKANRLFKARVAGNEIMFNLEQYKGVFFDEILTNDKNFFERNYNRIISKGNLNC